MEGRPRGEDTYPMYSRLFVVGGQSISEDVVREVFSEFGNIEELSCPLDRKTNASKGVAFIKFSSTSQAAKALEALHLKRLPQLNGKVFKVYVASNRSEVRSNDEFDDSKYKRLFITIPKNSTEQELSDYFRQFGTVDDVIIQRDRDSWECKGFAYIVFRKFSEAAKAFEESDKKYRAIFAQPKGQKRPKTSFESEISSLADNQVNLRNSLISTMNVYSEGYTRIKIRCSPVLTYYHVRRLCDLVPGMTECKYSVDLMRGFGQGVISYSSPIAAAFAVEKLDMFEFPPGQPIHCTPDQSSFNSNAQFSSSQFQNVFGNLKSAMNSASVLGKPDLALLADAIAQASKFMTKATSGACDDLGNTDLSYCNVQLPPLQPMADVNERMAKRCFLVCKPQPPPLKVLKDVFCRFGNLIDVYTLPNKTVGYASYSKAESADEAIRVLHGAELCGVRIKVIEAEEENTKRRRY